MPVSADLLSKFRQDKLKEAAQPAEVKLFSVNAKCA